MHLGLRLLDGPLSRSVGDGSGWGIGHAELGVGTSVQTPLLSCRAAQHCVRVFVGPRTGPISARNPDDF